MGETKRRLILQNRTDWVDSSGRGENGALTQHPQDPPCHPPPPPPLARRPVASLMKTLNQQQLLLGRPPGDPGAGFVPEHVDLAAHAETAREVDPGPDRAPDAP